MIFTLERITQPDIEPVSLEEMKTHLRCFGSMTNDDTLIQSLIRAAREWVEDYTGRILVDQTWCMTITRHQVNTLIDMAIGRHGVYFSNVAVNKIVLKRSPVLQVISLVSVDSHNNETTIDESNYQLILNSSKWPEIRALNGINFNNFDYLKINFRAGYAERTGSPVDGAEVVPDRFKNVIKLWVEANYDRDPIMMPKLLEIAEMIIKPERVNLQIS